MEQCRPHRLGGDGSGMMPWRTQPCLGEPGLGGCSTGVWGCCWAPRAPGTVLGCCHQQQKRRRLQAWQGISGLLVGLQQGVSAFKWDPLGLPKALGGRHPELQKQGETGQQGNEERDGAEGQQCPGKKQGQAKGATCGDAGLPQATRAEHMACPGLLAPAGCGARPPGRAGDNKAPGARAPAGPADGRGGLSLWPAGQAAALGNGAAIGPCPTGRGLQPNPLCFGEQMHPPGKYLLHWGSFGARCAPKPAAQGRNPPRTRLPTKICSATRHPLQGHGSPL